MTLLPQPMVRDVTDKAINVLYDTTIQLKTDTKLMGLGNMFNFLCQIWVDTSNMNNTLVGFRSTRLIQMTCVTRLIKRVIFVLTRHKYDTFIKILRF